MIAGSGSLQHIHFAPGRALIGKVLSQAAGSILRGIKRNAFEVSPLNWRLCERIAAGEAEHARSATLAMLREADRAVDRLCWIEGVRRSAQ